MALRTGKIKSWHVTAIAVALWAALSVTWSMVLIYGAFERVMHARLTARAQQLSAVIATSGVFPTTGPASSANLNVLINNYVLRDAVESTRRLDPNLSYAMVWTDAGTIVAHSQTEAITLTLDAEKWPALPPGTPTRIRTLHGVGRPHSAAETDILDVTVPLMLRGQTIGYISTGYKKSWYDGQFWTTQSQLVFVALFFTGGGALLIAFVMTWGQSRLQHSRRELEQTLRARTSLLTERGMLASVLAHEVRSPLTALRFNLHSLRTLITAPVKRDTDADRQLTLTDRCEREIRRLDQMLNDFLQRTQVVHEATPSPVNRVVGEALEFLRPALERGHIRIITHFDESNPHVAVNADELRQVVLNLAANAQDAMPAPKGGTLALSTLVEAQHVTLIIRDSGVGIPPALHERIFEPFFTTKQNGSGLGLALVRRVVSGAGGTVFCESQPGQGTTFRIVLPRADSSAPVPAGMPVAPRTSAFEPAQTSDEASPEVVIDHTAADSKPPAQT